MRKIYLIGIVALLSAIMVITPAMAQLTCSYDICVNETGWWRDGGEFNASGYPDYSIEDAVVNQAADGDTVFIQSGYYHHAGGHDGVISVHTPNLTIIGEGAEVVTLDFEDISGSDLGLYSGNSVIEGIKIVNSTYGIDVDPDAPDCIIRNCFFEGLISSFALDFAVSNITFANNTIANATGSQTLVVPINGSTIVGNTFINCPGNAIVLYRQNPAPGGIIARNNITSTGGKGIWLYNAGSGNRIYLNDFVGNPGGNVVYSGTPPTVIYWNSTEQIEYTYGGATYTNYLGNYWSDYNGSDGDGDGIGNVPYVVYGTDMDYHPLMTKFENYLAAPAGICGDVNKDKSVDFIDVGLVGRHKLYGDPLDDEWAADVNSDDSIDFIDAGLIGRHKLYGDALNCK